MKILYLAILSLIYNLSFAADHPVSQKDKQYVYSAPEIAAKVGDTITFTNEDTVTHNVIAKDSGGSDVFEVPKQEPGEKQTIELKSAGEITVRCAFHPKMKLKVKVE